MSKSKPTKEQILAAAKTSPEAKKALAKLFPDLFKPKGFNIKALARKGSTFKLFTEAQAKAAGFEDANFMEVRACGAYQHKGFYLESTYQWKLVKDGASMCLVPTKTAGIEYPQQMITLFGWHGMPSSLASKIEASFPGGQWSTNTEDIWRYQMPEGTTLDYIHKRWFGILMVLPDGDNTTVAVTQHTSFNAR